MSASRHDNTAEYQRRICRAMDFIQESLADNPSIEDIAAAAPFSRFHFQRLFKALVGETVAEFTRRVRLETAARKLLFNPDADITGLAFELGFSSSQNFAKAFRKHFDMSPTEFRQQASAGNPDHRTNGNIDRTAGNAFGDDDSYDPGHVLIGTRTEDIAIHVEVRDLPALRVAYRRHFGSYNDPGVQQAFDELRRWAEPRGLYDPENCLGIPWDDHDITPEEHCRFDACQIVDAEDRVDAGVGQQTIAAGRYAVFCCEVVQNDFDSPWTVLMQNWLPFSGYQPADGPRFERYLSDGSQDADGRWQIEICLPVRPL